MVFFFYRNYSFYTSLHLSFHLACMFHIAKHDVQMILYKALVLHFVQNNAQTLEKKILQARILENNTNYKKGKNVKTVTFLYFLEHSILISLRKKPKFRAATTGLHVKWPGTSAEIPYWWRATTQI